MTGRNRVYFINLCLIWGNICLKMEMSAKKTRALRVIFEELSLLRQIFHYIKVSIAAD